MSSNQIHITAPGRICLFGDHQDYLGLPIIACTINRHICIKAIPNDNQVLRIHKKDLNLRESIPIDDQLGIIKKGDFLRSSIRVLRKYGCIPSHGYNVKISGDIPINAGLSSSSALTVAWINFLIEAFGINKVITKKLISFLAYEVEVLDQQGSGGKMDQFTISHGGLIFLDTQDDQVIEFKNQIDNLIVGVSGISKDTEGTLSHLSSNARMAIEQVQKIKPYFDIRKTEEFKISEYINLVDTDLQSILEAAIINYHITMHAKEILMKDPLDYEKIGDLMSEHHRLLKENLKVTVPRIDDMIAASLRAGAYGAKIVGSGGGGCIVAMGDGLNNQAIIQEMIEAGAVDAFEVSVNK